MCEYVCARAHVCVSMCVHVMYVSVHTSECEDMCVVCITILTCALICMCECVYICECEFGVCVCVQACACIVGTHVFMYVGMHV